MHTNKYLEEKNNTPTRAQIHRKWKNIAREISNLNLELKDLDIMTSDKPRLAAALCDKHNITVGDMILLRQAYKAIEDGDTRAAEFFRDTMGENPKQVVEVQQSALSSMSEEELLQKLEELEQITHGESISST